MVYIASLPSQVCVNKIIQSQQYCFLLTLTVSDVFCLVRYIIFFSILLMQDIK